MTTLSKREQFVAAWEGQNATPEDVLSLYHRIEIDSFDLDARLRLIGHLFQKETISQQASYERFKQVIWIIENLPAFTGPIHGFIALDRIPESLWSIAASLWDSQIQKKPVDPLVLFNAAIFFSERDFNRCYSNFKVLLKEEPENSQYLYVLATSAYKRMQQASDAETRKHFAKILLQYGQARAQLRFSAEDDNREMFAMTSEAKFYLDDSL